MLSSTPCQFGCVPWMAQVARWSAAELKRRGIHWNSTDAPCGRVRITSSSCIRAIVKLRYVAGQGERPGTDDSDSVRVAIAVTTEWLSPRMRTVRRAGQLRSSCVASITASVAPVASH